MKTTPGIEKKSGSNTIFVTILGSGTCMPSLERSACSVLIQVVSKTSSGPLIPAEDLLTLQLD